MALLPMRRDLVSRRRRSFGFPGAAAAIAAFLISGCNGGSPIGDGVAPDKLTISAADANTIPAAQGSVRIFECITGSLSAVLTFTDGTAGNYTSRVQWVSTNEGVVRVSNGDILVPGSDNKYYPAGTLISVSPGTATVRAIYSAMEQDTVVSVAEPSGYSLRQDIYSLPVTIQSTTPPPASTSPVTPALPTMTQAQSMGIGTTEQFSLALVFDGVEKDATGAAQWQMATTGVASVSSAGLVTAQGVGSVTLQAALPLCQQTVSTSLSVANIVSVAMQPEFGSDPLLVGNYQRVFMNATLDNGATQDVSAQSTFTSTNPAIASFALGAGMNNLLTTASPGTVVIQGNALNRYPATDLTVQTASATLTGITICPKTVGMTPSTLCPAVQQAAVIRAGSDGIVQFKAMGTYSNGQVQDVTRAVVWGIVDRPQGTASKLGAVSNAKSNAGFVTSVGAPSTTGGSQVTATGSGGSSAAITAYDIVFDSAENPAQH